MIIRGENIGRNTKINENSKVILELIENCDLMAMDNIDLLTIINQGVFADSKVFREIYGTEPFSNERQVLLQNLKNGKTVNNDNINIEYDIDDEESDKDVKLNIENLNNDNKELSKLNAIKELKVIDSSPIAAISDNEAIKVLIDNKLNKMWDLVFRGILSLDDIISECTTAGKFYNYIAAIFKDEYLKVNNYEVPLGFNAHKVHKNGFVEYIKPNLMQKLFISRLKNHRYYGNWSGMGAGKTLSAIISSREINSHLTVLIVVNSTVDQWAKDILNAFPENTGTVVYKVSDNKYDTLNFDMSKFNYVIIPYSRFSQTNEEIHLNALANNKIDYIVMDEIHKAKNRGDDSDESKRRARLIKFINWAKQTNTELYKTAMTGTVCINELSEPKSLLSILLDDQLDDIDTKRYLQNALKLHQLLLIHGVRFIPKYEQKINILTGENNETLNINYDECLPKLKSLKSIEYEKETIDIKLNTVKNYIKKGIIIYSHYTDNGKIINKIQKYVESLGFSTGIYSSNNDTREIDLNKFKLGEIDVLIASDPINTGVDGLQEVCSNMIIITLPWTNADFEQLTARIYRQGMSDDKVSIIIPQVFVHDDDNNEWSWDKQRYDIIKMKKSLADCVNDGVIPTSKKFPSKEELYRQSIEKLQIWKERLNSGDELQRENSSIIIDLDINLEEYKKRNKSLISDMHRRANSSHSDTMHKALTIEEEINYHKARRESIISSWAEDPVEKIAEIINKYPSRYNKIIDLGCGENKLKTLTTRFVQGVNHTNLGDETIIEANMAHLEGIINNDEYNIAIFCLSLWGCGYEDFNAYFNEAYRILDEEGRMLIVEPADSFGEDKLYGTIEYFIQSIEKIGFKQVGNEFNRYDKIFFEFSKF